MERYATIYLGNIDFLLVYQKLEISIESLVNKLENKITVLKFIGVIGGAFFV